MRELTKHIQKPSKASYKDLLRVIGFVLRTPDYGLRFKPKMSEDVKEWDVMLYSDSDWAGDKDTRRSTTGFIIFVLGCPVSWRSRVQKQVSLSSSEAEYYALSEAAKEIAFVYQLLLTMGIKVNLPIIARVDNVGAIFMAENINTTCQSKHTQLRARYISEFIEDGFLKIIFVRSEDNKADGFTKNVSADVYENHREDMVVSRENFIPTHQTDNHKMKEGCQTVG